MIFICIYFFAPDLCSHLKVICLFCTCCIYVYAIPVYVLCYFLLDYLGCSFTLLVRNVSALENQSLLAIFFANVYFLFYYSYFCVQIPFKIRMYWPGRCSQCCQWRVFSCQPPIHRLPSFPLLSEGQALLEAWHSRTDSGWG